MPPLVIEDTLLVACSGTVVGQPWTNVWGVNTGGPTFMDQAAADLVADCFEDFYDAIKASLSDNWDLAEIVVYDLQSGTAPSYLAGITPFAGTNNGANLPPNMAVVVSHHTGLRGRRYNGRTYLAGWTVNDVTTTGAFNSTTAATIVTQVAALNTALQAIAATDYTLAVVSRVGGFSTPITSSSVNTAFDHQDRRKVT